MHPSFRPPRQAERGHRNRAARQHHAPGDGPNYTNWSRPISRLVWTMSPQVSARIQHEARKRREITGTIRVNRTRERAAPLPRTTARLPPDDSVKPQVRLPDVQAGEARPMIRRWISEVPSKIVKIFASRCQRSTGKSRV